jgi:hypothetical protein
MKLKPFRSCNACATATCILLFPKRRAIMIGFLWHSHDAWAGHWPRMRPFVRNITEQADEHTSFVQVIPGPLYVPPILLGTSSLVDVCPAALSTRCLFLCSLRFQKWVDPSCSSEQLCSESCQLRHLFAAKEGSCSRRMKQ